MPRLLRVHFASIGHRDARLAPLTLEMCDDAERATDSVVWLRNGGGKSSVLNLFFSTFRPNLHDFLGKAAEGQSRKLTDYVKASDTAFVVTEWALESAQGELALGSPETRLVGQVLEWRGRQRSADTSRLVRRFFSARTDETLRWASLPIVGLGPEPARSAEAFVGWLRERGAARPSLEVEIQDAQSRWERHLADIRLDPELFKYQLLMNRREGAADELFRFGSSRAFIEFFLELTLDPARADQVSSNLGDFREKLARLPERKLEHAFAVAAREALGPLVDAIAELARADARQEAAELRARGVAGGLQQVADRARAAAGEAKARLEVAIAAQRSAENHGRTLDRWRQGLERRSFVLRLEEARAAEAHADDAAKQAARRLRLYAACEPLERLRRNEARREELRIALAREEAELAPQLQRLEALGAVLVAALRAAESDARGLADKYDAEVEAAERARRAAAREVEAATVTAAEARMAAEAARERVREREQSREALLGEGLLRERESADDALTRWREAEATAAARIEALRTNAQELETTKRALAAERLTVVAEHQQRQGEAADAQQTCAAAHAERDVLEMSADLTELEVAERAHVFASGLEARLRDRAAACDARRMRSVVDGAEDTRALRAYESSSLLPAPVDVMRVVERLREAGVDAHSAPAYLAENIRDDERRKAALVGIEPARFFGVLVPSEQWEAACTVDGLGEGLRVPVTVTPTTLTAEAASAERLVCGPDGAGAYHYAAAAEARVEVEERAAKRAERQRALSERAVGVRRLADRVQQMVARWGEGRLETLVERVDMLAREVERLARREAELEGALREASASADAVSAELEAQRVSQQTAGARAERLSRHIERFEVPLPGWREARSAALLSERQAEAEKVSAEARMKAANDARDQALGRRFDARARADALGEERGAVTYTVTPDEEKAGVEERVMEDLGSARARYTSARRVYEEARGDSRLQGELDAVEDARAQDETALVRALGSDFSRADVEQTHRLAGARLSELSEESRERATETRAQLLAAQAETADAERALSAMPERQRRATDLPTEGEVPDTAEGCRQRMDELALESEAARVRAKEASVVADEVREGLHARHAQAQRLEAGVTRIRETCEVEPGPAIAVPEASAELEALVRTTIGAMKEARRARTQRQREVDQRVEGVRAVAHDARFSEQQSAVKQRLFDAADALVAQAERLDLGLRERIGALEDSIEKIEADRHAIITELLTVAEEGIRLLASAERASQLPAALGRWSGQPYLKVGLDVPSGEDERRARLGPLVDELVAAGRVPGGLTLAQQAIIRLHGSRDFRVTILKPEASRRLDRVPVTAMVNFSGGERLTAAILLYCTLVRLRARRRGRRGTHTGNVLILDNPIGTCSSVPLIELQREVARAMSTQLVYTTGVDDLAALAQLPNVIRLRNVHRNRRTGDLHVTTDAESRVEGVRVMRREAREAEGE